MRETKRASKATRRVIVGARFGFLSYFRPRQASKQPRVSGELPPLSVWSWLVSIRCRIAFAPIISNLDTPQSAAPSSSWPRSTGTVELPRTKVLLPRPPYEEPRAISIAPLIRFLQVSFVFGPLVFGARAAWHPRRRLYAVEWLPGKKRDTTVPVVPS